jgi:hypothetical protein
MQIASTNRPEGKGYVTAFGEWLTRYRVDDMDKSDRAKLLQLMEERPAVEEWRATLPAPERRSLNHPVIVWRKWTAATRVKKRKPRAGAVSAAEHGRALARIEELEQELATARERIAELEARGNYSKSIVFIFVTLVVGRIADHAGRERPAWAAINAVAELS